MPEAPDLSITILTYSRVDLAANIVARLAEYGTERCEVVVTCNGTPLAAAAALASTISHLGARVVTHADNRGFAGGANRALANAQGRAIALLSDDVAIVGNLAAHLFSALALWPDAMLCHAMVRWDGGWNRFGDMVVEYPQGYLLAARREVWDVVGPFDEATFPTADYEDVDLAMRCSRCSVPVVEVPTLPVAHLGAQTIGYTPERYANTVRMRAAFAAKWGLRNVPEAPETPGT